MAALARMVPKSSPPRLIRPPEMGWRSGPEIAVIRGHESTGVNWYAFNRDGTRIATASSDHTARVWDAATGKQIARLQIRQSRDGCSIQPRTERDCSPPPSTPRWCGTSPLKKSGGYRGRPGATVQWRRATTSTRWQTHRYPWRGKGRLRVERRGWQTVGGFAWPHAPRERRIE